MAERPELPFQTSLRERAERYRESRAGAEPLVPHLTPTRRKLLLAVQAGDVVEGTTEDHLTGALVPHTFLVDDPDKPRKVCARVKEAMDAGWVELPNDGVGPFWRLTEAGRKVLEASGG